MAPRRISNRLLFGIFLAAAAMLPQTGGGPVANGPLPGPFPLFPPSHWWNLDIPSAPVDPGSAGFVQFIGTGMGLHADFERDDRRAGPDICGMHYAVVGSMQPKKAV